MAPIQSTETLRVLAALRTAIRLSEKSFRSVERGLGMSTGYLTRIFAGDVCLRVSHIFGICEQIGLAPGALFAALFPQSEIGNLGRAIASLHPPFEERHEPVTVQAQ